MKRFTAIFLGMLICSSAAQAQVTIYWKKDHIRDASGAAIAVATPAPGPSGDNTAPTTPTGLSISTANSTQIGLSWTGSSDPGSPTSGLAGYVIYRGAVPVGAVGSGTTAFTDSGLIPATAYSYRVVAFDNAYNYSSFSSTLNTNTGAGSGAPTNLTAIAASTTQINLSWSAPGSAPHHYGIWRRSNGDYTKINTWSSTSYPDTSVSASTAYLYKISAEDASDAVQGWTNVDLATTVMFTDDTITVGTTVVKAAHVTELRTAVNAVRAAAGLSAASWTNTSLSGAWIQAADVSELRTNLNDAITSLGLTVPSYTDPTLTGVTIKKAHVEELRQRVK